MRSGTGNKAVVIRTDYAAVEIVDFSQEHAGAFRDLNVEWLERFFAIEPVDERVLSNPFGEIIAHGGFILMARRSGDVVGTVALKHHGDGVFELTKMAVTPRSQGQGIGRLLLAAAIDRFGFACGNRLYLESHSSLVTGSAPLRIAGLPARSAAAAIGVSPRRRIHGVRRGGRRSYGRRLN